MANSQTYDEILAETRAALAQLNGLIDAINAEMTAIEQKPNWRDDPATVERYKAHGEEAKALARTMKRQALETLPKLDQTQEVQELIKALRGVAKDLEKRKDKILRLGRIAEKFGAIFEGVAKGAEKLDALKKKFIGEDTPPTG